MSEEQDAKDLFTAELPSEDVELLKAMIQSPVFGAFKRATGRHKKEYEGILLNAKEPYHIHRAQGVILGLNVLENLPEILIRQELKRQELKKREEEIKKRTQRPVVKQKTDARIE